MTCAQLGWTFDANLGVCGDSNKGIGGCLHEATWSQAEARCRQYGARLCTWRELAVNKNSGCGHDAEYVWVWEECKHDGAGEHRVAAIGDRVFAHEYECLPVSELHAVSTHKSGVFH